MQTTAFKKWPSRAGIVLVVIASISWKSPQMALPSSFLELQSEQDTTKPIKKTRWSRDYSQADLDKAMKELDKVMIDLNTNLKIDLHNMKNEIKVALSEARNIDFDRINREVTASLKKIDWEKTRVDIDKAMREVDIKLKNIDMARIQQDVNESLAKAKVGIEKAKKELAELKAFTNSLEKDGLIDKKKGYKIEIRNKKLIINGKEQSKEVNDKYRQYLDREDFSITSEGRDDVETV